ncbi:FtsX-like permease family protein [Amnibacterium endophyticum]|uniref:FtsX-like permease family protein n=1 Tax=Amnibacterium endophyticum TaxID=2109337 RepID=A0ABW4LA14_9MICO
MGLLRLALAGLWWRRGTSALLLVVALFTTTAAAAAPSYAASARDAVLQAALLRAPVGERGTGITASTTVVGEPSTAALEAAVRDAFSGPARAAYPRPVLELSVVQRAADAQAAGAPYVSVVDRAGVCDALTITAGRCLRESERTGVVIDEATARAQRLRVGSTIGVAGIGLRGPTVDLKVVGIARKTDASAPYWFGGDDASGPVALQVWAPRSYFSALRAQPGDQVTATADLALETGRVHAESIDAFSRSVGGAVRALRSAPGTPTVSTGIDSVVSAGLASSTLVLVPIVVTIAELLALGWFLLHTLIGGAAEARGAEVALGKVRGLTGGRTLLLVLLEPTLLLAAAVPLGVLIATAVEHAFVPGVLGADVDVRVGWTSWLAAIGAAAGGLLATAAASLGVFRRPVLEQWRRTSRTPSRRGLVVEIVLVVLAVAGVVQLRLSGALAAGSANGIALLAPMLLLVAGALVASRLLVLLARLGFGPTRATGAVAAFVGLRQLVRRPAGRRTFGVVAVAVALAVYALSSVVVTGENRDQRALTDVGAPTVLHIEPDPRTAARIASVDPDGRSATAVAEVPIDASTSSDLFGTGASTTASPVMLVVDPGPFAAVAHWRSDFGSAPLARLTRPLAAPAPAAPRITGTALRMAVTGRTVPDGLTLQADLVDPRGTSVTAALGTLQPGARSYTAAVPACADGCALRRIYVTRSSLSAGLLTVRFTVTGAEGVTDGAPAPARPAITAVRWAPLNPLPPGQVTPAERLDTTSRGLDVAVNVSGSPSPTAPGFGGVAGAPDVVPGLVAQAIRGGASSLTVLTPDRAALPLRPVGQVSVLPRVGDAGVVVARDWLLAASPGGAALSQPDQVWIGPDAPSDTVQRLRAAGVQVLSIDRAAQRAQVLAAEGPAFASALILASGATAVLLAVFAVVLGLVLLARRRVFELSAMRALGIRRRSLLGTLLVEQAALVITATATGLVLALVSVQLALPAVPAYADQPPFPAFVVDQPVGLLLAVAGGVALLLIAAVAITGAALVRSASVVRLREAEQ